ncbi:antigen 5 like allergen Cul n 1-like [Lutzomyia longipalpis]|uniref:antigen 5 like allergen Cul n 1-like n=1 Tax=Lutzomyia longipalpis TaxID=7200 RepID=UPI002483D3EA|nr:antigen 5 like allergen Cul n 1-like [Lutzomyia longipalpis]
MLAYLILRNFLAVFEAKMVKIVVFSVLFCVVAVNCASPSTIDWCQMEEKYCNGREHIACEPNSFEYDPDSSGIEIVRMSKELKKVAVDTHNRHRSSVASGKIPGLSSATKMEKMVWNDHLAYVAEQHVKHGNFEHDQCRSFAQFPLSGQNLGIIYSSIPLRNLSQTLEDHINLFFDELTIVRDSMPSCIDTFTSYSPACIEAGHFTVMVKDINNAVGCAMAKFQAIYTGRPYFTVLTTCNYAHTNLISHQIYARGKPCLECASIGKSCEKATKLCV